MVPRKKVYFSLVAGLFVSIAHSSYGFHLSPKKPKSHGAQGPSFGGGMGSQGSPPFGLPGQGQSMFSPAGGGGAPLSSGLSGFGGGFNPSGSVQSQSSGPQGSVAFETALGQPGSNGGQFHQSSFGAPAASQPGNSGTQQFASAGLPLAGKGPEGSGSKSGGDHSPSPSFGLLPGAGVSIQTALGTAVGSALSSPGGVSTFKLPLINLTPTVTGNDLLMTQQVAYGQTYSGCPYGYYKDYMGRCVQGQNVVAQPCPECQRWDPNLQQCVGCCGSTQTCPAGSYLGPYGQCSQIQCPYGTQQDSISGQCITIVPTQQTCPWGTQWNPLTGQCASIQQTCPYGMQWNPLTGQCASIQQTCPYGMQWNPLTGQCASIQAVQPQIQCPYGTQMDTTSGQCVTIQQTCPYGMQWNPLSGQCSSPVSIQQVQQTCPWGTQWNPSTGQCSSPVQQCPLCNVCPECNNPTVVIQVQECISNGMVDANSLTNCLLQYVSPNSARSLSGMARSQPGFLELFSSKTSPPQKNARINKY